MPTGDARTATRKPPPQRRPRSCAGGFTYVGLLLLLAIVGAGLAAMGQRWSTTLHRAREAELDFRGHEIERAIASYWAASAPQGHALPRSLHDLIEDRRTGEVQRHLRRAYADPFTGQADWQFIVREPDGGLLGVRSRAAVPLMGTRGLPVEGGPRRALVSDRVFAFAVPAAAAASGPPDSTE
jgi:type II secretory pathway pseudopilin PulG